MGRQSQTIGLYRLNLGECDGAISEFERSVGWYSKTLQEFRTRRDSLGESEANNVLDLLYSALLSGDTELGHNAAEMALEVPGEFVDRFPTIYRFYYMKSLAASILNTDDRQEYLDSLEESLVDTSDTQHTFFEALWTALSGLEKADEDRFSTGVEQLLDWHHQQVDLENKTDAKDLVCRQGAALIVLARRKGVNVRVDSEYLPECVYELA